jgi:hypothetical protein
VFNWRTKLLVVVLKGLSPRRTVNASRKVTLTLILTESHSGYLISLLRLLLILSAVKANSKILRSAKHSLRYEVKPAAEMDDLDLEVQSTMPSSQTQ